MKNVASTLLGILMAAAVLAVLYLIVLLGANVWRFLGSDIAPESRAVYLRTSAGVRR